MKNLAAYMVAAGCLLGGVSSFAATLEVGTGKAYSDIQTAINAAQEGDTVLVYDGVYAITDQIVVDKAITVKSKNGAAKTEIRRIDVKSDTTAATERCLLISDELAVVDGFAISGGRIYNSGGSETADWIGAGVLIASAGGTLQNSVVTNCVMGRSGVYGGGLGMMGSKGVVSNCVIRANRNGFKTPTAIDGWNTQGAGVYMAGGLIVDSVIAENFDAAQNQHYGAGLYVKGGTIRRTQIVDNVIHRAEGDNKGAGVYVAGSGVVFEDCLIARNRTNRGTGGGLCAQQMVTLRRCTIADNAAYSCGGTYLSPNDCRAEDCVFAGNITYSDASAGSPDWNGGANIVFSNCLMSVAASAKSLDCVAGQAAFLDDDYTLSPASPLQGIGWKNPAAGTADFVRTGAKCIAGEDIVFTYGVQGNVAAQTTFTKNYAAAGTYSVVYGGVTKNVHVSAKTISVAAGGDIQAAIDSAEDGATVEVAADTYVLPAQLIVRKGIALVGAGAATTILKRTDTKKTSGTVGPLDLDGLENRCLLLNHPRASARGFTLRGGWCYAGSICYNLAWSGSGARIGPEGGYLSDCIITDCGQARMMKGGALSVLGKHSVASNCTVTANTSSGWITYGAGAWISGGGLITHSTISQNSNSTGNQNYGAGVYANEGRLSHCRVSGNTVANQAGGGAGVYATSSSFVCDNCLIEGNTATERQGGGVYASAGKFVNCTIVGNTAKEGGGVYGNNANLKFHNCLIQGNSVTGDSSTGAPEWNGANAVYTYSCSPKALPTADSGNQTGTVSFEAGSSYKIAAGSLAYDAGSSDAYAEYLGDTDIDGNARVWGDAIDIGCYEYFSTERYSASVTPPAGVILQDKSVVFTASLVNPLKLDLVCVWTVAGSAAAPVTNTSFGVTFATPGYQTVNLRIYDGEDAKDYPYVAYVTPHDIYVVSPDTTDHQASFPYATAQTAATNLYDAVLAANDGSTIHVAAGIHPVTNEIEIVEQVTVVGEAGAGQTIVRRNEPNNNYDCRQYRVLTINHANAVVRGLSIANGYLNNQQVRGAGVYIGALGGTLADSIVSNNVLWANMYTWGAGIYMAGGTVTNCLVCCNTNKTQSTDNAYGGGVCAFGGACVLESRIVRNVFYFNSNPKPTTATSHGGGATAGGNAVFRNCLFAGNVSEGAVGGLAAISQVYVTNCTFVANTSVTVRSAQGVDRAAGCENVGDARIDLVNCAFADNLAGGNLANVGTSAQIAKSAVAEVEATAFRNAGRGDFRPKASGGLVDAGQYADWMATATDLGGKPRATGRKTVDIGCYQANHNGLMLLVR